MLRAKPGAPWAIGERVGSAARGLYPVEYCKDVAPQKPASSSASASASLPPSVVRLPPAQQSAMPKTAASASSPRPNVATAASNGPSPRPNVATAASNAPSPRPNVATAASNAPSPRPSVATAAPNGPSPQPTTTRVTADFAINMEEQMSADAPVNVFSGVASTNLDGLRYEFEREPEKHVMETDKKNKALIGAVRRWMLIRAAADGNLDLVKCCIKGGVPVVRKRTGETRKAKAVLIFFIFLKLFPGHSRSSHWRYCCHGCYFAQKVCAREKSYQGSWISTKLCEQFNAERSSFCRGCK